MPRRVKRLIITAIVLGSLAVAPVAIAKDPIALSSATSRIVQDYLAKVGGRFGALAVSTDGSRAAYYICQARLWKNCDDYELNDRFVSIPSGRLAAQKAMSRCGGSCVVLYLNDKRLNPPGNVPAIR